VQRLVGHHALPLEAGMGNAEGSEYAATPGQARAPLCGWPRGARGRGSCGAPRRGGSPAPTCRRRVARAP
jgi:hypothetical protein